ncbi:MAG: FxsA family protein [Actinomycetota bacterium]
MILLLLFVIVPIAELYTIIKVGGAIGFFNTLGIIIAVAVIGSWLVKREGLRVWTKFNEAIAQGRVPTREIIDGVLILGAGALLLTPGFLTDVFGVLMLFPPTRMIFRSYLMRRAKRGTAFVVRGFGGGTTTTHFGGRDVVDTESTEPKGEL